MALTWSSFTDYLDGSRPIVKAERDELWSNLDALLSLCGGRWRLKTADMDAIKASLAITDLTSLEQTADTGATEVGDLAKVLIDIEDVFTGTTGYDAFKAVRADEGLTSDDQLAEFVGAGGRATERDTWHLWNLYKRVLDYLQCCPATAPTFQWDSVSASKTMCSDFFRELICTGDASPVRFFRKVTYSGSIVLNEYYGQHCVITFTASGEKTFNEDCTLAADTTKITVDEDYLGAPGYTNTHREFSPSAGPGCHGVDIYPFPPYVFYWGFTTEGGSSYTDTSSTTTVVVIPGIGIPNTASGAITNTLSDEYFPADLVAAARAAMPAFDGDWTDTAGSYRNLSSDGLSYSERQGKARVPLAGVTLAVGRAYRVVYIPRFSPLGGGVVDGDEARIEFTFEEGMEFTDEITVDVPDGNGTNTLVGVRWECGPFAP